MGVNKKLFVIPEITSFNDVRDVLAHALNDLQNSIVNQLPVVDYGGERISNVGTPVASDDVVTLKWLQGGGLASTQTVTNTSTGTGGGAPDTDKATFIFQNRFIPNGTATITNTYTVADATNYLEVLDTIVPIKAGAALTGTSTGTTSIALEVSTDAGASWSTICADVIVGTATRVGPLITSFTISPITPGSLLRARVDTGSANDGGDVTTVLEYK